jgi:RNA polymerase-associated protein RTF1
LSRDLLEKWIETPYFDDAVRGSSLFHLLLTHGNPIGCFARIGLGLDRNRQPSYRVVRIVEVVDYHRMYKVNTTPTKKALKVRHGKAEKIFLMDVVSNADFNEVIVYE